MDPFKDIVTRAKAAGLSERKIHVLFTEAGISHATFVNWTLKGVHKSIPRWLYLLKAADKPVPPTKTSTWKYLGKNAEEFFRLAGYKTIEIERWQKGDLLPIKVYKAVYNKLLQYEKDQKLIEKHQSYFKSSERA